MLDGRSIAFSLGIFLMTKQYIFCYNSVIIPIEYIDMAVFWIQILTVGKNYRAHGGHLFSNKALLDQRNPSVGAEQWF